MPRVTPREVASVEDHPDHLFSGREVEVLALRSNGVTYAETADMLGITESEVGQYVTRIRRKVKQSRDTIAAAADFPK